MTELDLVSCDTLQRKLGLSRSTLWRLRQKGLPSRKVGRSIRYSLSAVQAWLQMHGRVVSPSVAQNADQQSPMVPDSEGENKPSAFADLPPCHWKLSVALDPRHRPQTLEAPSSTVRKDWRKLPQEAHLLDLRGHRYRRLTEDEIAIIQGFPSDWAKNLGLTPRERIAGLGNAVPPPLAEAIFSAMAEAVGRQLKTGVEICAGFGGLALGAHRSIGMKHLALVEFWEAGVRVLRSSDIWDPAAIHLADVLKYDWNSIKEEVDVLSGGPPCQPWSQAGLSKGESDDRDLLGEMPALVAKLRPRTFIFENVPGLMSPKHRDYLQSLVHALKGADPSVGYGVAIGIVQAADFGVPQKRRRVIIAGIRGTSDGRAHEFFDLLYQRRTHTNPARAIPHGLKPWLTLGSTLPAWHRAPGWRRWIDEPSEGLAVSEQKEHKEAVPPPLAQSDGGISSQRPALSMGLVWPGRDHALAWDGGHWVVEPFLDKGSNNICPLLPSRSSTGRPLLDPWYVVGDHLNSLESLRPAVGRQAKLLYFEPPRIDTDLTSFAAADSRNRLNTWLTMNQATLRRAMSLLRDDGAIAILTGVVEQPYLQVMLDELFGPENRIGTVVWQKGYSVQGQKRDKPKKDIYATHDYIIIYTKRREECLPGVALMTPPKNFSNPDSDPRGPWKAEQKGANYRRESSDFAINLPPYRWEIVGGEVPTWIWRVSPKSGVIWVPAEKITEAGEWHIKIRVEDSHGAQIEKDFTIRITGENEAPQQCAPSWLVARDASGRPTNDDIPANAPKGVGPLRILTEELPAGCVGKPYFACLEAEGGKPYLGTTRPGKSSKSGKSRYWDLSYGSLESAAAEDAIDFKSKDDSIPAVKVYLDSASYTYNNQISTWRGDGKGKISGGKSDPMRVGWGQDAKKELEELFNSGLVHKVTNIGKPTALMSRLLGLFTNDEDLVVDVGSPTAEMAAMACQLRRRVVYVDVQGTEEDGNKIRLPRLRTAAKGAHPIPDGLLFFEVASDAPEAGYFVAHKQRDRESTADVCEFEVGRPFLHRDTNVGVTSIDYEEYASGSQKFLQALASLEGLVWASGADEIFAQSSDGRVLAVHLSGLSILDRRMLLGIVEKHDQHLSHAGNRLRIYYHRGHEGLSPLGSASVELRHVPFGLIQAAGGWS